MEINEAREFRLQSRVRREELLHGYGVAGNDYYQLIAIVFHRFQQRVDRLLTIRIGIGRSVLTACQRICLVDEQHAAERFLHNFRSFDSRLSQVPSDKTTPICLYYLSAG